MCRCTPNLRTPFCGKPGCEWPKQKEAPQLLRVPTTFHSVADVLETAKQLDLNNVMVLSEREDGALVFLETDMTLASANWLLDRMKMLLLMPAQHDKIK